MYSCTTTATRLYHNGNVVPFVFVLHDEDDGDHHDDLYPPLPAESQQYHNDSLLQSFGSFPNRDGNNNIIQEVPQNEDDLTMISRSTTSPRTNPPHDHSLSHSCNRVRGILAPSSYPTKSDLVLAPLGREYSKYDPKDKEEPFKKKNASSSINETVNPQIQPLLQIITQVLDLLDDEEEDWLENNDSSLRL